MTYSITKLVANKKKFSHSSEYIFHVNNHMDHEMIHVNCSPLIRVKIFSSFARQFVHMNLYDYHIDSEARNKNNRVIVYNYDLI